MPVYDEHNNILLAGEIPTKETETLHMDTQQSNVNDVNDDVISLEDGTETTENEQSGHDTLNLGTGVNDNTELPKEMQESQNAAVA